MFQFSDVESPNSIGVCERYHGPLIRVFNKLREDKPRVEPEVALRLATKA